MAQFGTPTYDQLQVFLAVVEAGSFAAAARRLGRATSVVSYAIANLETQLGVALFDRTQSKTPKLTEAGRTVLAEARTIASGMDGLRAKVKGLLEGLEAEVHVALDVMLPAARVVDALKAFSEAFPTVTLRLYVEALGAVAEMVLNGRAVIGVSGALPVMAPALEHIDIGFVDLIPVAAPDHPLALAGHNPPGAGRDHVQLVLTDRSRLTEGVEFAVLGNRTWRLADIGSKHMLLREGIGWGNLPEPMVREDLAAGRLVRLDLPDLRGGRYHLQAIYRADTPPGPAGSWLIQRLQAQACSEARQSAGTDADRDLSPPPA
ncbi:LysR family transcriptional regulator [Azorhizobium doebereinerae]|uniref:LysR family transcriptional regulator n=1 Tax=Azorhizobium doebereinerae TaxID=281091 RepID=UPI0004241C52|nr:LysR family transcriptional regulator [Azorhizobium doebereinerae]